MLRIGVVGLGNIAQKAYLPVMAQMQDQVDWVLCTRDPQKLTNLKQKFGFESAVHTVQDLLASKIDAVFIHTPTSTHTALIRQFLKAGVHVYVDKPISEDFTEVSELYRLASQKNLLLTAGFNRRFAPLQAAVAVPKQPAVVMVQKNRADDPQPVQFAVYDLFIHAVDTALFLAGVATRSEIIDCQYQWHEQAGNLQSCGLVMKTSNQTVYVLMNMQSGANSETSESECQTATKRLIDLTQLAVKTSSGEQVTKLPDWTPMLVQRGFAPLIHQFVDAVATTGANPVPPETSLLSHQLCAELVADWQQRRIEKD